MSKSGGWDWPPMIWWQNGLIRRRSCRRRWRYYIPDDSERGINHFADIVHWLKIDGIFVNENNEVFDLELGKIIDILLNF